MGFTYYETYTTDMITIVDYGGAYADAFVTNTNVPFDTVSLWDYEAGKRVPRNEAKRRITDALARFTADA